MALSVLSAGGSVTAMAGESNAWRVLETTDGVKWKRNGIDWEPLQASDLLAAGAEVETGPAARAVLAHEGDTVTLSPSSRIAVPQQANGARTDILHSLGTLLFRIRKRDTNQFRVETPYMAAVVKGTTFTVTVNNEGAALHLTEGVVEVASLQTNEVKLIHPGQTVTIGKNPNAGLQLGAAASPTKSSNGGAGDAANGTAQGTAGSNGIQQSLGGADIDIGAVTGGLIQDDRGAKSPNSSNRGKAASSGSIKPGAASRGSARANAVRRNAGTKMINDRSTKAKTANLPSTRGNGVGAGGNNGVGPGNNNGVGPGANNGVGPGNNNGVGPGANNGVGPGNNNGVGPGANNGVGNGNGNGKKK